MTEEVELFDVSSGKTYCVSLRPEDAERAYNDPNLLSEILRVLTNNDENKELVAKETASSETPESSISSNASSEQHIETSHYGVEDVENESSSPGIIDEIDVKHHLTFADKVSDDGENSNESIIEQSSANVTIEFITGSWCEESGLDLEEKSKSNAFQWTDVAVHTLIAQIDENSDLVATQKRMNQGFWELIAGRMNEKGFLLNKGQCVSKWRRMINNYKNALSNRRQAAASDTLSNDCSYLQAMDDLCKLKGWALELCDSEDHSNTGEVTFASLLRFFDSYKANDALISGKMTEQKYLEFQTYLQTAGWQWAVRTSSKAPKDWYIFNYEKGDLKIPYFGHPFILKKNTLLECVHGDLYYGLTNQRKKSLSKNALRPKNDGPECLNSMDFKNGEPPQKKRALKPTKKFSCPAFMKVVLLYYFPDYKIDCCESLTWRNKNKVIQQLKRDIKLEKSIQTVAQYIVKMSLPNSHNHRISPPKAIVTPMAPIPMKAYVDTHHENLKEQNSRIDEIRDVCSKIVKLTNSPMKRGTSVKDLQLVLDRLREEHQSMESMFESSGSNG
uniref:Myb/SANT-like DNA-binding domain-containing protein n=1 Tax=Lygus hesperus TaxID=30085 RepID=A0A146L309_LYGHE